MDIVVGLTVLIAIISIYFLPTIMAQTRNHKNTVPIFIVNLFLGWTFIVWVGILAWAFMDGEK